MQAYYQQQQQQRQQPFGGGGGLGGVGGGNTGAGSLAPGSAGSLRCAPCASLRLGAARDLTPLFFLHYCNVFFSVCPFSSSNRPSRLVAVSSFPRCLDLLCPPPAPYQQRRRLQQEQALVAVRGPVTLAVLAALWEAVAARHSPPAIVRFCIQPRLALDKKEAAQTIDLFSLFSRLRKRKGLPARSRAYQPRDPRRGPSRAQQKTRGRPRAGDHHVALFWYRKTVGGG